MRSALILALSLAAANAQPPLGKPIWNEAELHAMTLPAVLASGKILYLPPDSYYKRPALKIYKSYPVYKPEAEPKDYMQWLEHQEPEIAFDATRISSPRDWARAGELVFNAPLEYEPLELVRDGEWYAKLRIPVSREGIVPGYTYVVRKKGVVEVGTGGCAVCHTRVLEDGSLIAGAQGNFPVDRVYAEKLRKQTKPITDRKFAKGLLLPPAELDQWTDELYSRSKAEVIAILNTMVPGTALRAGFSLMDPPKIADLIGVGERRYLEATARVRNRGPLDLARYAMMCVGDSYFFSRADALPANVLAAAEKGERLSDEQAYALALYLTSLQPPRNPNRPSSVTKKGQQIFAREGCADCHTPPAYSNNKLIPAGDFRPTGDQLKELDVVNRRIGTDAYPAIQSPRARGYYSVPSLGGLWYRGPLEHSGRIERLEDWFNPARLNADYFPTGYVALNERPRPVPGHEFGLELNAPDKAALLAFLRTL